MFRQILPPELCRFASEEIVGVLRVGFRLFFLVFRLVVGFRREEWALRPRFVRF